MLSKKGRLTFLEDFGSLRSEIGRCIRCGFCNSVCPTSNIASAFKESRTSRGRLIMLQSLLEGIGELDPYSSHFKELMDLCFACRRCVEVCPAGIPIPDLMIHARYAYLKRRALIGMNLGQWIFARYEAFDKLGSLSAPLSNWLLGRKTFRKVMELIAKIDARSPIPTFSSNSLIKWFNARPRIQSRRKIVYFVDSYANYNQPELGRTVVTMLERLGYEVLIPPQRATAMPSVEYGMLDFARRIARYNIRHLAPYAERGIPIVCSSPAASFMLKHGYVDLMGDQESEMLAEDIYDIHEFLMNEYRDGRASFTREVNSRRLLYHYCCLSKALKTGPATMSLLQLCGYDVAQADECCGSAGVWGMLRDNYEVSLEIGQPIFEKARGSEITVTESETCKLQIGYHSGKAVLFPIEILAQHLRRGASKTAPDAR